MVCQTSERTGESIYRLGVSSFNYGKNSVVLIENLNEIFPKLRSQWGLVQEPHWESRTSSQTSLRSKNLIKNLIKNQDLEQDLTEILIEILNKDFFLIENLNENLLIFDEVLDEVLDFLLFRLLIVQIRPQPHILALYGSNALTPGNCYHATW